MTTAINMSKQLNDFCEKYGFPESVFNDETPLLTFAMENPFVGK